MKVNALYITTDQNVGIKNKDKLCESTKRKRWRFNMHFLFPS